MVAGIIACIPEDKNRFKYRQEHSLVRADGVGDWAAAIDEILTGPTAQVILPEARPEQRALTERLGTESWQYQAVAKLHSALRRLDDSIAPLPDKVDGRRWFRIFAQIRNKTKGHGADPAGLLSGLCEPIEGSLRLFMENFSLFSRECAYLHRNLSGKYRISAISDEVPHFEHLKKSSAETLPDGVYIFMGTPALIGLVQSDADLLDFYLPNGHFTDTQYEMLSYITGDRIRLPSQRYLTPPDLPISKTEGLGELDVEGECFTNLPPELSDYVNRPELERHVLELLLDDHHPIITLGGSGGVGKTSLALCVLHRLLPRDRFKGVFWFSSRDIDLFAEGAKPVKPRIMNEEDASDEFTRLLQVGKVSRKVRVEMFTRCLTHAEFPLDLLNSDNSATGKNDWPMLFVFDNFETVVRPAEFFKWLDTHIRLPNKLLITTRVRSFQGDYAVPVEGMDEDECRRLIARSAEALKISRLLTEGYMRDLIRESQGHPYVIKILLGEVAKSHKTQKLAHILASRSDILQALFERTYQSLSPGARRIFLTLCGWRSTVPLIVLEAVLLHTQTDENFDVAQAVEELHQSSLIEIVESEADRQSFLSVPLVAALFGKGKFEASPLNAQIRADTELLQQLGGAHRTDVRRGVTPRVTRLIRSIARDSKDIEHYRPMLEFIARRDPPMWLELAKFYEEAEKMESAKEALRYYLEQTPKEQWRPALEDLARLCQRSNDVPGEIDALVKQAEVADVEYRLISNAANRFTSLVRADYKIFSADEKRAFAQRLRTAMEEGIREATATDLSRLAWLCLRLGDEPAADKYVQQGLSQEPDNEHCLRLLDKKVH